MFLLAAACAAFGFYTMYTYGNIEGNPKDYTGHVVGGDAYNFIIIGIRGVGWLVAGLINAVCGACLVIRAGQVDLQERLSQSSKDLLRAIREGSSVSQAS